MANAPKKTGAQKKNRTTTKSPAAKPGLRKVKSGAGKGAKGSVHAAKQAGGVKTSATRKAGPKSVPKGTTSKSREKSGGGKKHAAKKAAVKKSQAIKKKTK